MFSGRNHNCQRGVWESRALQVAAWQLRSSPGWDTGARWRPSAQPGWGWDAGGGGGEKKALSKALGFCIYLGAFILFYRM
jgi:hypothetical protein